MRPGPFTSINYSKADLWAVGTIAYELFGMENPFYNRELKLNSTNYDESQLPQLPAEVPSLLRRLVANLLSKSPSSVCSIQLFLKDN